MNMGTRSATMEPLCARPFSYLRVGLFFGVAISYYDYWRRNALQSAMYTEDKVRYYTLVKGMNANIRYGEEDDIQNLTDYLAGYSLKP
jgi:hypothetical protein